MQSMRESLEKTTMRHREGTVRNVEVYFEQRRVRSDLFVAVNPADIQET